jgi:hypothetical protein
MLLDIAAAPGWYFAQNKQKFGPVTLEHLQQLVSLGRLRSDDMVLQQGTHKWQAVGSLSDVVPPSAAPKTVLATTTVVVNPPGWCYARNGTKFGPLTLAQVRHQVALKHIQPDDMVLPQGKTKWQPASSCPELFPQPAVPAPTPPAPAGWFYAQNKQKVGPVSVEQLRLLAGMGALRSTDMVLPPGGTKWQSASSVVNLFPTSPAPVPPPAPPISNGAPPAPPDATPAGWHYLHGKKKIGPVSLEQMQQLVAFGLLHGPDMVLPAARSKWCSVSELPQLMPAPKPEPASLPPPVSGWFYAVDRKKCGPVTREEVERLAAEGRLLPSDMVLPEGSTKWVSGGLIEGLFPALISSPPVDAEASPDEDSVFPMAPPKPPPPATLESEDGTELVETEHAAPPETVAPSEDDASAPAEDSIIEDDTAQPSEPDSSDSLLKRLADFEEPSSVVGDELPKASVFDSFVGSMIKDQPLPPVAKPRLRPSSDRACPHCHGTAYCGRKWDGAGIMESGPVCDRCKEKSGLDASALGKVTCSYCQGKGFAVDERDIETWPADALAWRLRGLACSDVGNYEQAIAAFSQALDLEPSYADAYYDRGWAYLAVGRSDEGEIDLAEAARLSPKYAAPPKPATEAEVARRRPGWWGRK